MGKTMQNLWDFVEYCHNVSNLSENSSRTAGTPAFFALAEIGKTMDFI
jgi:hypothetical protein